MPSPYKVWLLALALLAVSASVSAEGDEPVLTATLTVSRDAVAAGEAADLVLKVAMSGHWHVNAAKPADPMLIPTRLKLEGPEELSLGEPVYPEPKSRTFGFSEKPLLVYEGRFEIRVPFEVDESASPGPRAVQGKLRYQACDDERCLAPRNAAVAVLVNVTPAKGAALAPATDPAAGYAAAPTAQVAQATSSDAPAGAAPARSLDDVPVCADHAESEAGGGFLSSNRIQTMLEEGNLLAYGLIFLVGLALNLTPCVYPVIPITLGFFANQSEQRGGKTFGLALVYVLGMALMYSALGVFAALSGKAFGSALSSPIVLVFEAVVMIALATSMFGLWNFGIPAGLASKLGASPSGYAGALFMGLTVGIVAAPCLAPVVLGLFVFVGKMGSVGLGFAVFFTLALGLGVPYLILGTLSGAMSGLPRAGEWMLWIKHLFGFLLLGMALYFLRPLLGDPLFAIGIPLLALVGGIFLGFVVKAGRTVRFRTFRWVTGVALCLLAVPAFLFLRPVEVDGIAWSDYQPTAFDQSLGGGAPVLVDFTAEWCLPCKELEKFTFSDEAVAREATRFKSFKADGTFEGEPEIEALQARFDVKGYPTILFIGSDGAERTECRVVGFVDAEDFLGRLQAIR